MFNVDPTEHYRARRARKRQRQECQRRQAPYTDDYERRLMQPPQGTIYRKPFKNPRHEKEVPLT